MFLNQEPIPLTPHKHIYSLLLFLTVAHNSHQPHDTHWLGPWLGPEPFPRGFGISLDLAWPCFSCTPYTLYTAYDKSFLLFPSKNARDALNRGNQACHYLRILLAVHKYCLQWLFSLQLRIQVFRTTINHKHHGKWNETKITRLLPLSSLREDTSTRKPQ